MTPDARGEIHEEELQHAVVRYLLKGYSPKADEVYASSVEKRIGRGNPPASFEDAVKGALQDVVRAGHLTKTDAEAVNGISFRAAQLDDNLDALFDGTGGKGDPTIATMKIDAAARQAEKTISDIRSGAIAFQPRPLDARSNKVSDIRRDAGGSVSSASGSSLSGSGSVASSTPTEGFLWKPVSEKDGKLVVLLPPELTGKVKTTAVYSALPPSASTLIERGSYSGEGNGGREHFRFSKSGSSFPEKSFVVVALSDGTKRTFAAP